MVVGFLAVMVAWESVMAQEPLGFTMEAFIPVNLSAKVGDTVQIPIRLRNLSTVAQQMMVENFSFSFRFNPTVLLPVPPARERFFSAPIFANNLAEVNITVPMNNRRLRNNDTLLLIPMLVCLGDVEITELSIDRSARGYRFSIKPAGLEGFPIAASSGLLRIEDARWNNFLLTVNANAGQLDMRIAPNPLRNSSTISLNIGTLPPPPTLGNPSLVFYTSTGRDVDNRNFILEIDKLVQNLAGKTSASFSLPTGSLAVLTRGIYFARFTYGSSSVTRIVVVE